MGHAPDPDAADRGGPASGDDLDIAACVAELSDGSGGYEDAPPPLCGAQFVGHARRRGGRRGHTARTQANRGNGAGGAADCPVGRGGGRHEGAQRGQHCDGMPRALHMTRVPFVVTAPELRAALGRALPVLCGEPSAVRDVIIYRSRSTPAPPAGRDNGPLTCVAYVVYDGPPPKDGALPATMRIGQGGEVSLDHGKPADGDLRGGIVLEPTSQPAPPLRLAPTRTLYGKVWSLGQAPEPLSFAQLLELLRLAAPNAVRHLALASLASTVRRVQVAETEFLCECQDESGAAELKNGLDEQRVVHQGGTFLVSCEHTSDRPSGGDPTARRAPREAVYKPLFVPRDQWRLDPSEWNHEVVSARGTNWALVRAALHAPGVAALPAGVVPFMSPSAAHWQPSPSSNATTPHTGGSALGDGGGSTAYAAFPSAPVALHPCAAPQPTLAPLGGYCGLGEDAPSGPHSRAQPPVPSPAAASQASQHTPNGRCGVKQVLRQSLEAVRLSLSDGSPHSGLRVNAEFMDAVLLGAAAYATVAGHWGLDGPNCRQRPQTQLELQQAWQSLLAHYHAAAPELAVPLGAAAQQHAGDARRMLGGYAPAAADGLCAAGGCAPTAAAMRPGPGGGPGRRKPRLPLQLGLAPAGSADRDR
eukprot:TRINITY_DN10616_c0_g1_i2.p1 TRINITY_DN10616_c0_g1~~TRINITY_DN10616_c0_g1_i2.p1  ORF type:complete len:667 (+),score=123.06 TRINITY_DN10616_c0_g1_i2:70-2001(+)